MKTERYWKQTYGITLTDIRKIFFAGQEGRCACCRTHIGFMGRESSYDKVTKTIICHRCRLAIVAMRKLPAALIPKLLEFVNGNNSVDDTAETAKESPALVRTIQDKHKGNFPP